MLRFVIRTTPWVIGLILTLQAGAFVYGGLSRTFGWQAHEEALSSLGWIFAIGAGLIFFFAFVGFRLIFGLWLETYRLADLLKGVRRGLPGGPSQDVVMRDVAQFRHRLGNLFSQFLWVMALAAVMFGVVLSSRYLFLSDFGLTMVFIVAGLCYIILAGFVCSWHEVRTMFADFLPAKR